MAIVSTHGINPALYGSMPFDPVAHFVPFTLAATSPNVLAVHPDSPCRSVQDIIGAVLDQQTAMTLASVPSARAVRHAPDGDLAGGEAARGA